MNNAVEFFGYLEPLIMELPQHRECELIDLIVAKLLRDDVLSAEYLLDDILDAEEIG